MANSESTLSFLLLQPKNEYRCACLAQVIIYFSMFLCIFQFIVFIGITFNFTSGGNSSSTKIDPACIITDVSIILTVLPILFGAKFGAMISRYQYCETKVESDVIHQNMAGKCHHANIIRKYFRSAIICFLIAEPFKYFMMILYIVVYLPVKIDIRINNLTTVDNTTLSIFGPVENYQCVYNVDRSWVFWVITVTNLFTIVSTAFYVKFSLEEKKIIVHSLKSFPLCKKFNSDYAYSKWYHEKFNVYPPFDTRNVHHENENEFDVWLGKI